jgi:hypothetical protein
VGPEIGERMARDEREKARQRTFRQRNSREHFKTQPQAIREVYAPLIMGLQRNECRMVTGVPLSPQPHDGLCASLYPALVLPWAMQGHQRRLLPAGRGAELQSSPAYRCKRVGRCLRPSPTWVLRLLFASFAVG